jgi:hypothetical protein
LNRKFIYASSNHFIREGGFRMKQRVLWEGIEIWPHEDGDEQGPHGTLLAEYIMDAVVEAEMRQQLVQLCRDQGLGVGAKFLYKSLDYRANLQDCVNWVKQLLELVKKSPSSSKNDTSNVKELPPILLSGKFWVRAEDIKDKAGWKIMDHHRRRRNKTLKREVVQPEKKMTPEELNALDNLGGR